MTPDHECPEHPEKDGCADNSEDDTNPEALTF
jgi:hypothetical protein